MKKLFFSLMALFALCIGANAQVEPVAGETYYIQNEDGQFLSRGNAWGTQASLDAYGMPWTLVGTDLTSVQLQILGQTSVLGFDTGLYTDASGSNARSYVITGNTTDGYTITSTTGYACYIDGTLVSGSTTETAAKWKFLTKAQRDEYVNNAIATAKTNAYTTAGFTESTTLREVDVTSSVTNNGLGSNTDGWTVTISRTQTGQPASSNSCTELWHATGSLTQTVSGLLANGLYKLEIRAQYRCGGSSNDAAYEMYNTNGYNHVNATVGLNGNNVPVCHWASYSGKPNVRSAFETAINSGSDVYLNTVYGNADADGNLTITINKPGYAGSIDWFTFGQIKLYQLTDQVSADDITALEATIPTGAMDATVASTMSDAKDALDADASLVNYNALADAIEAANTSIAAYASAKATADKASAMATAANVDVTSATTAFTTAYEAGTLNGTTEADAVTTAYETALSTKLAECTDFTSKITNPSFEEGSTNGWTNTDCGAAANNGKFGSATGSYFVEKWTWSGSASNVLADGTLTQTIASLPIGEYILTAEAQNWQQGDATVTPGGFYITIGDKQVEVSNVAGTFAVSFTTTEKSDITIGAKIASCTGNWVCVDNFKLYFNGIDTQLLKDEITTATTQYNSYDATKDYAITLKSAIDDAQESADAGFTKASDLNTAVSTLQAAEATAKAAYLADNYADLADGKYILSTDGLYLGAANSWGTQASLLAHPEYVELTKLADGKYYIKSQVDNDSSNPGTWCYFNGSFMDGTATEIAIIKIGDNYYLTADGSNFYYNNSGIVGTKTDMTAWTVTSIADMDAKMADATEAAPMDVTYKVLDPNFGRNNIWDSAWEKTTVGDHGGDNTNMLYEAYCKTFSMKQTLTDLTAGTYMVKATAMYRQDGSDENLPYMYANRAVTDFAVNTGGESTMATAATAMAAGSYEISAKVYVSDGNLELGFATTGTSCWSIWDNVQLYYLGSERASVARTTESGKHGTICMPYNFEADGATLYTIDAINSDNGSITLAEVGTIGTAGVPYIYCATTDGAQTFAYDNGETVSAPVAGANGLTGSFTKVAVPAGSYVMQTQDDVQGFYKVADETTVNCGANKCYLTVPTSDVKAYLFGGDETAISALNALTSGNAAIYDLNGRQLSRLQKGINIVNGKKIIVK